MCDYQDVNPKPVAATYLTLFHNFAYLPFVELKWKKYKNFFFFLNLRSSGPHSPLSKHFFTQLTKGYFSFMATVHCKTQYLHLSTVSVLRQSEWCRGAGPVVLLALLSFPDSPITLLEKRWTPPVRQQLIVCLDVWLDWALATVSALTKQARCLPGHFPVIAWSCRWQGEAKESVKKSLMGRGEWIVRGEKKSPGCDH